MSILPSEKQQQLLAELQGVPEEYYPFVLQMIRNYRESVLPDQIRDDPRWDFHQKYRKAD